jgi:hypothetical protein
MNVMMSDVMNDEHVRHDNGLSTDVQLQPVNVNEYGQH